MVKPVFFPFIIKHLVRHRLRSFLTIAGVALAMFLFCSVRVMHNGIHAATMTTAEETSLVVYRKDRYCPFSSLLPQDYGRQIAQIPGVTAVVPIKLHVSNCRASLDVVTFRGVPYDAFDGYLSDVTIIYGNVEEWRRRNDAVLIGERLAQRRGFKTGDRFSVAGITVTVAGVFRSGNIQDQAMAYAHLDFIQRNSTGEGIVTQFNVRIADPEKLDPIAAEIDELFRTAQDPTQTWSEQAFTARAISDVVELVAFASLLGWGALVAIFALVVNAIILSVQERVRDHAVLQTLGYRPALIARLIITESTVLSVSGGVIGLAGAALFLYFGHFTFSTEGISVHFVVTLSLVLMGLALCLFLGIGAGLFPAWVASKKRITDCLRAV